MFLSLVTGILALSAAVLAQDLTLKVCSDDNHVVYIDGQQVATSPFNTASTSNVPKTAKVIAVQVTNTAGPGGLKAAFSDNSVVSDSSWRCSSTLKSGWQNIDFDDSSWSAPLTSGSTTACTGFTSSAQWLWSGNDYNSITTIYCRKTLAWNLKLCSDDDHVIYVDGQQVASGPFNVASNVIVPVTAKVIAVQVANTAGPGGFKAAFSDNTVVTDGSWKCSSALKNGWQNVDFDDSLWSAPLTTGTTTGCTGFTSSAQWLWTGSDYNSIITIYCRKTLAWNLKVCSDDEHVVYVDGQQVASSPFNTVSNVGVPKSAEVIAIQVKNTAGPGGLKAAFSDNSVVTDDSWKCSSTLRNGWQNIDFDDSQWSAPLTTGSAAACPGFPSAAKWLWTGSDYNSIITIYCRKTLTLNLKVCSDDDHVVYVDGQQVANSPFNVASNIAVPSTAKVIAIQVTNTAGPGGFKAAFSDNSIVTDGSWKCSSSLRSGWQNVAFDDSSWSAPLTTGTTTACAGFTSSAKWLWSGNDYNSLITVYCRKTLTWNLNVCSDDEHVVYVDGQQVASSPFNVPSSVSVRRTAKLIAVQVKNTGGPGGLKAAFSDSSVVSDGSWKCSSTLKNGWQNVEFDDSSWSAPLTTGTTTGCVGFPSSAQWLWSGNDYNSLTTVYCRKSLNWNLKVCSDDDHIIYVDGKQVASGPFNTPSYLGVPSTAKVIAVQVKNTAGPGGFKATFSDNRIVTDGSWKCSSTLKDGWQNVGFDDSSWSAPLTSGTTTACTGFPSSAQWLWAGNDYNSLITIYCRKTLTQNLKVCSDDDHVVYVDGQQVASSPFNTPSNAAVPVSAKVIAVQVKNTAGPGGFKAAYADNSIVTDGSWKCSSTLKDGWQNVDFDDSSWSAPLTSGTTTACTGFPSSAQWLWTGNDYNSLITIYCRKTLTRNLKVCSDDDHIVYIDEQRVANGAFNVPSNIAVSSNAKVIAIQVTNTAGPGGIKAAFSDNSIVTDSSWKCSSTLKNGWQNIDFDDSSWSAPLTTGTNQYTACAGFPSSAQWLWTGNDYNSIITIYCRKTLTRNLKTCSDDDHVVYVDGLQVASSPFNVASTVNIPINAKLIAVQVKNTAGPGGFKSAFADNSFVTDGSWKCSSTLQSGWQNVEFDDSSWSTPLTSGTTTACTDFPSSAKWLWVGNDYNSLITIYCRKSLKVSPCASSPCQNGGACKWTGGANYTCTCASGFSGINCQTSESNPCLSTPCLNGGTCTKTSGTTFTCKCADGYSGTKCETENNPCSSSPCKNGGVCTKTSGTTFTCQCAVGYSGSDCSTAGPCAKNPCQNGGTCVPNGASDYDCSCTNDYDDGEDCSAYQDPCTSSPCKNGGKCNRLSAQTFSCSCVGNYIGNFCELKNGTDPCSNKPCQNGGTCTSATSSTYSCSCPQRYEGQICEKVVCLSDTAGCTGLAFGKYAYCSDCGKWIACKAKKQKLKSCASRAPNVYYNRKLKTCIADKTTACSGLS